MTKYIHYEFIPLVMHIQYITDCTKL
uniref:Uncharacterized protein n=1 Tax=Anguilla anguilla TaxID=7936 RepID=A0A0E9VU14_ANGAN